MSEITVPLWDWNTHLRFLSAPHRFKPGRRGLTEEIIAKLLQEKDGNFQRVPGDPPPEIPVEFREAVGTDQQVCPLCDGNRSVYRLCAGAVTQVQVMWPSPCVCKLHRRYFSRWCNPKFVSKDYRDCTMENLLSGKLRKRLGRLDDTAYATVIAAIQQFKFYNCLLVGPAGTGKTTLMTALLDQALSAWAQRSFDEDLATAGVWKVKALQLAAEQQDWAMKDSRKEGDQITHPPTVTPETIIDAVSEPNNFTAHVAIDEFDKYKTLSDFQNGKFHLIIDECQSNAGQVVCNSNLDIQQLMRKIGFHYAAPILRRLVGEPRGMYIHFGEGRVYVNNVRHRLDSDGKLVPVEGDTLESRFAPADQKSTTYVSTGTTASYPASPAKGAQTPSAVRQTQPVGGVRVSGSATGRRSGNSPRFGNAGKGPINSTKGIGD